MRLDHVAESFGEWEEETRGLLGELASVGVEHILHAPHAESAAVKDVEAHLGLPVLPGPMAVLTHAAILVARWSERPPELVHAFGWSASASALVARRVLGLGAPVVVTLHGLPRWHAPGALLAWLERWVVEEAELVTSASTRLRERWQALGAGEGRVVVIPLLRGVDLVRFHGESAARLGGALRSALGLRGARFVVGAYVGSASDLAALQPWLERSQRERGAWRWLVETPSRALKDAVEAMAGGAAVVVGPDQALDDVALADASDAYLAMDGSAQVARGLAAAAMRVPVVGLACAAGWPQVEHLGHVGVEGEALWLGLNSLERAGREREILGARARDWVRRYATPDEARGLLISCYTRVTSSSEAAVPGGGGSGRPGRRELL